MREREIIDSLQIDLGRNRVLQKVFFGLTLVGGTALGVEVATAQGPNIEGMEAVKFGATLLLTLGSFALASLAKLGEGTYTNAIRYYRHELSTSSFRAQQAPSYNPRINLN